MRNWIVGLLLAGIFISAVVGFVVSGYAQQPQQQGPDEACLTLIGQCVYNNNANSIRAMTALRQLNVIQEQEKATAEYWARWIGAVPAEESK